MDKFVIKGGKKLKGEIAVSGAKNVALKVLVAACLTKEPVVIKNIPKISDFFVMVDIIKEIGGKVSISDHTATVEVGQIKKNTISLEDAAAIRTSSMFLAPLLGRCKKAIIPNPGGCRIGARPIDRVVKGLSALNAKVVYKSKDGYFHSETDGLRGSEYTFEKNTHTGTETLMLAATLAKGTTVLNNAASEPEVDELIEVLNQMGAQVTRREPRTIVIEGVKSLHGATISIGSDRNEVVTFAAAALMTDGDVIIKSAKVSGIESFLEKYKEAGGGFEATSSGLRFFYKGPLKAVDITTAPYPGFMTDWQGPWMLLMTKAKGDSIVHETVYENRFGYVEGLEKMGADIVLFNPKVPDRKLFYNFNMEDDKKEFKHAAKVKGPKVLHNAVVDVSDLRAGATLVLAALSAKGESVILGAEILDRGYEQLEKRLEPLGADIKRIKE